MNHFYVYAYLRHDGSPYYIGKGKDKRAWKKGKDEIGKPIDISRIVILQENLSDDEAKEHEINLIKIYGRIDLGNGILRNKTDGGDGACLIGEQNGMFSRTKEKHHAYGKKRPDMTGEHNPMHGKKREEEKKLIVKQKETKDHLVYCVNKYGETLGNIIANGRIRLGMTKEMCITAWGEPYNINKTIESSGTYEIWNYGWQKFLNFTNGVLVKINE